MRSQPPPGSEPGDGPPRRQLDRPPSERYAGVPRADGSAPRPEESAATGGSGRPVSLPHGPGAAFAIAVLGGLAVVLVYGLAAITSGLIAIAGTTGFLTGLALRGDDGAPGRAIAIATLAVIAGILGGWGVSIAEGGVVGPLDYIGQTLGPLALFVPLVAAAGAWLGSR